MQIFFLGGRDFAQANSDKFFPGHAEKAVDLKELVFYTSNTFLKKIENPDNNRTERKRGNPY
jgi:hypothetical protein